MCQVIIGLGGHIGFWIRLKGKILSRYHIKNICAKFGVDPAAFVEKKSKM